MMVAGFAEPAASRTGSLASPPAHQATTSSSTKPMTPPSSIHASSSLCGCGRLPACLAIIHPPPLETFVLFPQLFVLRFQAPHLLHHVPQLVSAPRPRTLPTIELLPSSVACS